jgi:zeta-carotene desaturase
VSVARRESDAKRPSVGIVGGGLAGISAACALADAGFRITLFERKSFLGGRASSYEHPGTGEVVDNCQHVLLGCCTNLLDLYRRLGVEDKVRWYRRITFIEPGGRSSFIEASSLPAPFHSVFSFVRYKLLSLRDKLGIARALIELLPGVPLDSREDFLSWLRRKGQTEAAIERFWTPVLVSSLNEELDKSSVKYAAMVFRDAFLKSAEAGRMGVPTIPLSELYGVAAEYIAARGGEVLLRSGVDAVSCDECRATLRSNDREFSFDYAISAIPFHTLGRILPQSPASEELQRTVGHLRTVPITGIHLWFDREITPLEHAALLNRNIQWMFQKSKILTRSTARCTGDGGSYLELVVSSSKNLLQMSKTEIVELAMKELAEFFPAARDAELVKSIVIKEVHATFAPAPLSDEFRPSPSSPWARLFLSGDWISTGWPSTMEGAVRAGYLAAETLSSAAGIARRFSVPDLEPQGFMRLFRL